MSDWKPPAAGALDDTPWPDKLIAHAIDPREADRRLHGYSILRDLAVHYRTSDLVYLAIVGELPDDRASAWFHVASCAFVAVSVAEAPVHVAVLGRICGGSLASALGAGAIALADQARLLVETHAALLAWLAAPTASVPAPFRSDPPDAVTASLRALAPDAPVDPHMTADAARLALLFASGIRTAERVQAAIVAARSTGLIAEALAASPANLKDYPVKLPPFHYVDEG